MEIDRPGGAKRPLPGRRPVEAVRGGKGFADRPAAIMGRLALGGLSGLARCGPFTEAWALTGFAESKCIIIVPPPVQVSEGVDGDVCPHEQSVAAEGGVDRCPRLSVLRAGAVAFFRAARRPGRAALSDQW